VEAPVGSAMIIAKYAFLEKAYPSIDAPCAIVLHVDEEIDAMGAKVVEANLQDGMSDFAAGRISIDASPACLMPRRTIESVERFPRRHFPPALSRYPA
jgi:hypothetical protein